MLVCQSVLGCWFHCVFTRCGFPEPRLRRTASGGAPKISLHFLSAVNFILSARSGGLLVEWRPQYKAVGVPWPILWIIVAEVDHSPNWPNSTLARVEFARCAVLSLLCCAHLHRGSCDTHPRLCNTKVRLAWFDQRLNEGNCGCNSITRVHPRNQPLRQRWPTWHDVQLVSHRVNIGRKEGCSNGFFSCATQAKCCLGQCFLGPCHLGQLSLRPGYLGQLLQL